MGHRDRISGAWVKRVSPLVAMATVAGALLALPSPSPVAADVTAVTGNAYGYFLTVGLFGGPPNLRGPAPQVTLASNGSNSPQTATAPSAVATVGPANFFTSGQLDVSTQGTTGPAGSVTTTANIMNINTANGGAFGATNVASSCTSSATGVLIGTTTITGGVLEIDSGDDINGDGDFTDPGEHAPVFVPVPTNPAANSAPVPGHIHVNSSQDNFSYQFNEQITNPDGSLTVYAAHQVLIGPTAVGDLFLGKAQCGLTGTPVLPTTTTTVPPTTTTTVPPTTTTTVPPTTTTTVPPTTTIPTQPPTKQADGYRLVAADGGIFTFGDRAFLGSTGDIRLAQPIVGGASNVAAGPKVNGYWIVARDGGIFTFGQAGYFGSAPERGFSTNTVVAMAAVPNGTGYWMVTAAGKVLAFGSAPDLGSVTTALNKPIVAMTPTSDGAGYWLLAGDGGIFSFGSAQFFGSTGNLKLNSPVVDFEAVPGDAGYWLAAGDGGIFSFGSAEFKGSTGDLKLNKPVVAMLSTPNGAGYWMAASDGGIFSFGAPFLGSTGDIRLNSPILDMID